MHDPETLNEVADFLRAAYRWQLEEKFLELLAVAAAPLSEENLFDLTLRFCDQARGSKPADFLAAVKQEISHLARQSEPSPLAQVVAEESREQLYKLAHLSSWASNTTPPPTRSASPSSATSGPPTSG
jgi:hypothetical protein